MSCLIQDKSTFNHGKIVNISIVTRELVLLTLMVIETVI